MHSILLISVSFLLLTGVSSLDCYFEAKNAGIQLNIHDGIDTCGSGDSYCFTLNYQGTFARGCSQTAQKIEGLRGPSLCTAEGCNDDKSFCCCSGNKCNSSSGISIVFAFLLVIGCSF
uniref:Activin_recp domain-containing protein n=1 Tax=Caenorhabditis tropicalis TaxID=1561998 RepID=A0A1I7UIR2_9PELO